jgi:hypothetical protein
MQSCIGGLIAVIIRSGVCSTSQSDEQKRAEDDDQQLFAVGLRGRRNRRADASQFATRSAFWEFDHISAGPLLKQHSRIW